MPISPQIRIVGALVLAATLTAGCGSSDGPGADSVPTRQFVADNGTVTIPVKPKRVVATGYAVPALLESGAPLVGISTWKRGLPLMSAAERKSYDELPKIAGESAAETNYQAIAKTDPDVIIIGVPKVALGDINMKRLTSIAPVVALGPTVPKAWRELSRKQADAAGALKGYEAVRTSYEQKAAQLAEKYKSVLPKLKFGHVGAYGEVSKGNFQREFNGSWGTNVTQDMGANYYGRVKVMGKGAKSVSEYPSIEELPAAFGEADAITYSVEEDGSVPPQVQYVLDSPLWKNLPAVKANMIFPLRYTEASTYREAELTLDAADKAFSRLLK